MAKTKNKDSMIKIIFSSLRDMLKEDVGEEEAWQEVSATTQKALKDCLVRVNKMASQTSPKTQNKSRSINKLSQSGIKNVAEKEKMPRVKNSKINSKPALNQDKEIEL